MIIRNTWFKHYPQRLRTRKSFGDKIRNQIDNILVSKQKLDQVQTTKVTMFQL